MSSQECEIKIMKKCKKDNKCASCGKVFTLTNTLRQHIKTIHEGHRDYKCNSYGKSFSQAGHLKRHIKSIQEDQ